VILKRFNTRQPTPGSSSDSNSSALSGSDWRKIRRLIDRAVADRDQKKISELNQMIHQLSIQSTLVQDENKRLEQALINERLRKKRGKALPLEQPEDYHGGAVFWSPRKVKEARDCQHQQELEEEQQQLQKAERACVQENKKHFKLCTAQEKRAARAAARIILEKEKAKKAAEQAPRATAWRTQQQLQQALKTAQKRRKRGLNAAATAGSKKRAVVRLIASGEPQGAVAAAPAIQSRRSGAINTPKRSL
jgi:hypothetical protein